MVLNEGHISDSILYYATLAVQGIQPALFILMLLLFYILVSLFIQSTSGMAVLTILVNIPGREIFNAYMYGMCIMSFIAPTGLMLPSLAMVNVSIKTWLRFIIQFLITLTIICAVALVVGIYL